jgi:hypothetical protein
VTEKKALGLGPLIGQTVHKIGHNCMGDSAPRSGDLVLAVVVHSDATTTPCDVEIAVLVSFRRAIQRF